MVLVKFLGAVDLASALAFLMLVFGMQPWLQFILFCSGLLLVKGLFAFKGNVLSMFDLFAAVILLLSLIFTIPSIFLWIPSFLLLAKGVVSFI
nr:hypothetical protein [uncultured archaeon]AQS29479.1 hypothetical protein [uncultured archaeon]